MKSLCGYINTYARRYSDTDTVLEICMHLCVCQVVGGGGGGVGGGGACVCACVYMREREH